MTFQNLARFNEIGANCYVVDTENCRIVLDCGLHPKAEGYEATPHLDELQPGSVDAIILTHAHLDHAGSMPVLMRDHREAPLYLTPPTAGLADAMLHNSVNVMQSKREELGLTDYPLFGHREIEIQQGRWEHRQYNQPFEVAPGVTVTFFNAGHILGSCGVLIEADGQTLFYTGDIQFADQCLIQGAEFPTEGIDHLIIETTRGAAPRRPDYNREDEKEALCDAINVALERGGSALIPVFAMGKTQEVLAMVHQFKEDGKIADRTPVFIGGLSTKMTGIFDDYEGSIYRRDKDFVMMEDMGIMTSSRKKNKRKPITYRPGAIFALSSGMMTEKTVSNTFARNFINNPKNSLLFVGYADPATPGGLLREHERGTTIELDSNEPPVMFDCDMEVFDFSGHSTRDEILDYILQVKPKNAFLVHGDLDASTWFEQQVNSRLENTQAILPKPKKKYALG